MNSGLKIREAVLYIRFNGSTVERRPSFSIEFIKLFRIYIFIKPTVEICVEQLDYRLLPAFQVRNAIFITVNWGFYSGQNGIHYGQILTVRSTYFTP